VAQLRDALAVARGLPEEPWHAYTRQSYFDTVLRLLVAAGDVETAREAVEMYPDARGKAELYAALAEALARRGDVAGARRALALVQPPADRFTVDEAQGARRDIAIALAKAGDFPAALRAVEEVTEWLRPYTLARVALEQARAAKDPAAGKPTFRRALDLIRANAARMGFPGDYDTSGVALLMAKAGDVAGALELARSLSSVGARARTLGGIAMVLDGRNPFAHATWKYWGAYFPHQAVEV
jgi:tetratricopeptide (TPR) repeat protein